ncbi:MAG: hypothetical protein F6J89_13805 [Symploca sp. SIO1C4]|uniref:Uncharacterized protein n=1 Tax=Symploca sp. SIO1C4 TaxID=2607765 RepID=A0A6B3NAQ8_9CYAN|nr:hypothetical protein [Symploca sp. SIO1C4]
MKKKHSTNRLSELEQQLDGDHLSPPPPPSPSGSGSLFNLEKAVEKPKKQPQPQNHRRQVRSFDDGKPIEIITPEGDDSLMTAQAFDFNEDITVQQQDYAKASSWDDDYAEASSWDDDYVDEMATGDVPFQASSFEPEEEEISHAAEFTNATSSDSNDIAREVEALRHEVRSLKALALPRQSLQQPTASTAQSSPHSDALGARLQEIRNEVKQLQWQKQQQPPQQTEALAAQMEALRDELRSLRNSREAEALNHEYWEALELEPTFQDFDQKMDEEHSPSLSETAQHVPVEVVPAAVAHPQAKAMEVELSEQFNDFDRMMDEETSNAAAFSVSSDRESQPFDTEAAAMGVEENWNLPEELATESYVAQLGLDKPQGIMPYVPPLFPDPKIFSSSKSSIFSSYKGPRFKSIFLVKSDGAEEKKSDAHERDYGAKQSRSWNYEIVNQMDKNEAIREHFLFSLDRFNTISLKGQLINVPQEASRSNWTIQLLLASNPKFGKFQSVDSKQFLLPVFLKQFKCQDRGKNIFEFEIKLSDVFQEQLIKTKQEIDELVEQLIKTEKEIKINRIADKTTAPVPTFVLGANLIEVKTNKAYDNSSAWTYFHVSIAWDIKAIEAIDRARVIMLDPTRKSLASSFNIRERSLAQKLGIAMRDDERQELNTALKSKFDANTIATFFKRSDSSDSSDTYYFSTPWASALLCRLNSTEKYYYASDLFVQGGSRSLFDLEERKTVQTYEKRMQYMQWADIYKYRSSEDIPWKWYSFDSEKYLLNHAVTQGISSCAGGVTFPYDSSDEVPEWILLWHLDAAVPVVLPVFLQVILQDVETPLRTIVSAFPTAGELYKYRPEILYHGHKSPNSCQTIFIPRGANLYKDTSALIQGHENFGLQFNKTDVKLVGTSEFNMSTMMSFAQKAFSKDLAAQDFVKILERDYLDNLFGTFRYGKNLEEYLKLLNKLNSPKEREKIRSDIDTIQEKNSFMFSSHDSLPTLFSKLYKVSKTVSDANIFFTGCMGELHLDGEIKGKNGGLWTPIKNYEIINRHWPQPGHN